MAGLNLSSLIQAILASTALSLPALANGRHANWRSRVVEARDEGINVENCYNIFLDIGSNRGNHGRFLMEPHRYPKARYPTQIFDEWLGKERNNTETCIFAFEPNPQHFKRQRQIERVYNKNNWKYTFLPVAVGTKEGRTTFTNNPIGKSAESKASLGFSSAVDGGGESIEVRQIDLAKFMNEHIKNRRVPAQSATGTHRPPRIIAKMDIEGGEYATLLHMLGEDALCMIDVLTIEFHGDRKSIDTSTVSFAHKGNATMFSKGLKLIVNSNEKCKTTVLELDDESYIWDKNSIE